jgi:hypothetical protein
LSSKNHELRKELTTRDTAVLLRSIADALDRGYVSVGEKVLPANGGVRVKGVLKQKSDGIAWSLRLQGRAALDAGASTEPPSEAEPTSPAARVQAALLQMRAALEANTLPNRHLIRALAIDLARLEGAGHRATASELSPGPLDDLRVAVEEGDVLAATRTLDALQDALSRVI